MKTDKNTLIGLLLIVGLVATWLIVQNLTKKDEPPEDPKKITQRDPVKTDSLPPVVQDTAASNTTDEVEKAVIEIGDTLGGVAITDSSMIDSINAAKVDKELVEMYGDFASMAKGEALPIHVHTDKLDIDISTKGGSVEQIILNTYKTYGGEPLPMIEDLSNSSISMQFMHGVKSMNTKDFYFMPVEGVKSVTVKGNETKMLQLRAKIDDKRYIEQKYTFYGDKFDYDWEISFVEINDLIKNGYYDIFWQSTLPMTEKSHKINQQKAKICYRSGSVERMGNLGNKQQEKDIKDQLTWVSFKNQFFAHTIMCQGEEQFGNALLHQERNNNEGMIANMDARMEVGLPMNSNTGIAKFKVYAGPLDFKTLRSYDNKLERQLAIGWGPLKYINTYFFMPIFRLLEDWIGIYWVIILIMAILIKVLLFPLTYKTFISSAKMRILNQTPEVKAMEEKFKDDPTKLQQEKMAFYRQIGASPFGGCLPMILQYPFLISLFYLFPASIALRQQKFLWADDLSAYDSIISWEAHVPLISDYFGNHISLFTLLMTISIFLFTYINQRGQASINPQMKYLPYIMPLFFMVFLNNYAAGLAFYYLCSNLLSVSQTTITKLAINDEKLLREMREKQKKRKASGKKGRLEGWMEKQQKRQKEIQRQQQKNRKR